MQDSLASRTAELLAIGLALLVSGCGKSPAFNKAVVGTVELDGKPLPNVLVQFIPVAEDGMQLPFSSAVTDVSGSFRMTAGNKKSGAVIGKHKVVIAAADRQRPGRSSRDEDEGTELPAEYASATDSPIEIEVTAEKHNYEIALTRPSGK
jgi:hypothetical protein